MNEMKKISTIKRGGLMALAGVAALGMAGFASAATITVDTTAIGGGTVDGKCDLLEAIASAVNDSNTTIANVNPTDAVCTGGSGNDTIVFSPEVSGGTIQFTAASGAASVPTAGAAYAAGEAFGPTAILIQIPADPSGAGTGLPAGTDTGSITIDGGTEGMTLKRTTISDSSTAPGSTQDGFRLITILGNPATTTTVPTTVTLKNLTLTGGFADGGAGGSGAATTNKGGGGGGGGGGPGVGGAIFVGETAESAVGGITLNVENVTITGNRADGGDGAAAGTATIDTAGATGGGGGGGLYDGSPGVSVGGGAGATGGAGGDEFTVAGGGGGAGGTAGNGGTNAAALYEGGGGGGATDNGAGFIGGHGFVASTAVGTFSGGGGGGQGLGANAGGNGGNGGLFGGGGGVGVGNAVGTAGNGGTYGGAGGTAKGTADTIPAGAGGGGAGVGGGIFAYDVNTATGKGTVTVNVTNSTITNNNANMGTGANNGSGIGGGIASLNAKVNVSNSTIVGNIASTAGAGIMSIYDGSPIPTTGTGNATLTVVSSIISGNKVGATTPLAIGGTLPSTATADDINSKDLNASAVAGTGLTKSGSDNLSQADNVGVGVTVTADPMLADLADNDGPTMTMALPAASPAVDKGNANGQTTDQRGEDRAVDGDGDGTATADIGAYEYQPGVDAVDGTGDATEDAGDGTSDATTDATDDTGGKGDATDDTGTTDDVTGTSNTDEATSTEITAATDSTLGITAIKVSTANGVWKVAPSVSAKAKANGISYPLGIVSYSVTLDGGKGAMAEVGIDFDGGSTLDISKYKVRKEVDDTYKQMTKITSAANAKDGSYLINTANQSVTLYITDGGKWDSDASANGVVVDPVGMTSGGSSGGGGGCTLDTSSTTRDMSLLGLLGLGLVGLFRRRFFKGDAA